MQTTKRKPKAETTAINNFGFGDAVVGDNDPEPDIENN
jgi:hypothetical protein